ncbi:unnamed protein product [Adineta steineri]|uniref:Uncharacterized protein n=1 Tax=Adineta steineri TaxID=433720 RepID=A0A815A4X5_9BILA|nr:unnamed protein product [Adineta steineri]CAF1536292.1 unnamed protein product [Adineta steineri]CAF1543572.1 unnamed protein product [Adineta steineri]CAF1658423.1 unnamed protein product [Adineta steineri]
MQSASKHTVRYNWECTLGTRLWTCSGSKRCGNTYGSCIDVPSEPLDTNGRTILIVFGVITFLVIVAGILFTYYYRRRQRRQQRAAREFGFVSRIAFQNPQQPPFQSLEVLNCRTFINSSNDIPPTYQQATQNKHGNIEHDLK